MILAYRITRWPEAFDPARGEEAAAGAGLPSGPARDLVRGVAGCSPYLAGLIGRERDWLDEALSSPPEAALDRLLAAAAERREGDTGDVLRRGKRRLALLVALCDCGGVWSLSETTTALTRFADAALDAALAAQVGRELARGRIPGQGPDAIADAAGLTALAMGKMGAFELNYSSDIDLICLFDDARFEGPDLAEARSAFVRAVRRAMATLSDLRGDGYVFRTDLRLRPDPSATPVALAVAAAERYYEALGRPWERAALIKARPAAGATEVGAAFLAAIRPFVWRRHLDFAAIEDADAIRRKIHAQRDRGSDTLDDRNVKLAPGGIREIEFFTQTRQLIAGGRDPDLRCRGTLAALDRLAGRNWVPAADAAELRDGYRRLRDIEHRLQMIGDEQTHALPRDADGWQRLACFLGDGDAAALQAELRGLFLRVHELCEGFFTPDAPPAPADAAADDPAAAAFVQRWLDYPALRSSRARGIFRRIVPDLLARFDRAPDRGEAMTQFDRFLSGLPAGVQLLSLFEANPHLVDLMVDISSTAPALAEYLSNHPGVLDAVIGGDFFAPWPGAEALAADLSGRLADPDLDHERRLDAARRWAKDWHFRVGVHHLRGLIAPMEAAAHYADLADAVLVGLLDAARIETERKHGRIDGAGAVVMGMGSLGARQLNAASDLDLIVIYDAAGDPVSEGRKPVPAKTYFTRLTKALVTAVSAKTAAGGLYEVDMRLRPSGRQGPVATSLSAFCAYQRDSAWVWEQLALTRARPVAGPPDLARSLEAARREILNRGRATADVLAGLRDMRRRLSEARPRRSAWDVVHGPGGLQDIELLAQAAALLAGSPARDVAGQLAAAGGLLSTEDARRLADGHARLFTVKLVGRLLTGGVVDPEAVGAGGRALLLRDTGFDEIAALSEGLQETVDGAAAIVSRAVGD